MEKEAGLESQEQSSGPSALVSAWTGTYEFWRDLLQGEVESPTIRFAGETRRYRWRQNPETVEVRVVSS